MDSMGMEQYKSTVAVLAFSSEFSPSMDSFILLYWNVLSDTCATKSPISPRGTSLVSAPVFRSRQVVLRPLISRMSALLACMKYSRLLVSSTLYRIYRLPVEYKGHFSSNRVSPASASKTWDRASRVTSR